ncbi:MAG TPA: BMP family ABC transporter substrate-binding protein [Conexibacter sp.]|nr:BMP family ABC transporter substrate-binding protein [Conexibacter sp.]
MSTTGDGRRRSLAILVLVAACLLALALGACGGSDSNDDSTSAAGTTGGAKTDYKVAVLSVGNKTDGSYGQSLAEGSAGAATKTGAKVDFVGNLNTPDQYVSQGTSFAQAGYNMVLIGHGAMGPVVVQLAKKFPDTTFCHTLLPFGRGMENPPRNTCFFFARGELGAFRAGALAGLISRSGVVGANQALVFPALNAQINDFALGVKCVNPRADVLTTITNNDADPSPTKTASEAQIAKGADVLFGATGTAMAGVFQAANDHPGTLAIGQYVDAAPSAPRAVVASTIVNYQDVVPYLVQQGIDGRLPQQQVLGSGLPIRIGYLKFNDPVYAQVSADQKAAYDKIDAAVESDAIKVPGPDRVGNPGDWRNVDVSTIGCKPAA